MSPEKIKVVIERYTTILRERGAEPVRHTSHAFPSCDEGVQHALWMLSEMITFIAEGKLEKAFRWLGFIQGVLWAAHVRSIDDMRRDNMPDEAEFKEREG